MFREGPIQGVIIRPLKRFEDARGWLIELFREDELPTTFRSVMAYVSETLPYVARGPHEHREQTDCFAFVGPGDFRVYLWDARPSSPTLGNRMTILAGASERQLVLVPPGVVHAYKNVSEVPGLAFNCPDCLYAQEGKKGPVDEIRHEDRPDSPFVLD
ncbi:MAG: dTDP-4-dehydrorhamnose 3,5-epimerase family protein [Planctomycetota bacterium]|jgi:dTDP-4-dehydrorhamnose 3,5-epimerase